MKASNNYKLNTDQQNLMWLKRNGYKPKSVKPMSFTGRDLSWLKIDGYLKNKIEKPQTEQNHIGLPSKVRIHLFVKLWSIVMNYKLDFCLMLLNCYQFISAHIKL